MRRVRSCCGPWSWTRRWPDARYNLAFAHSALGDYQAALKETKLALELNPYIPTPRFRLLIDLHFEPAGVFAPDLDAGTHLDTSQGVASFDFRAAQELEGVFGEVPQRRPVPACWPQPGEELLQAAARRWSADCWNRHCRRSQQAGVLGASRMEVLLLQGEIFLRRGLSGEAVERFDAALAEIARSGSADQDAALRRALHGAARSLLDLDRMAQAVEAAERLCELAPKDVEALRTLGYALSRVEDYGRAAIVLEQARAVAPDDIGVLTQLGTAYAAAGDLERAENALRHAVDTDELAVGAATRWRRCWRAADAPMRRRRSTRGRCDCCHRTARRRSGWRGCTSSRGECAQPYT
jgi:cellulose synthase operon protein C